MAAVSGGTIKIWQLGEGLREASSCEDWYGMEGGRGKQQMVSQERAEGQRAEGLSKLYWWARPPQCWGCWP